MKTIPLGRSELMVSQAALGTMYFGTTVDEAASFAVLDAYYEAGGRFLDTANCYSFWAGGGIGDESELVIGRWLKARRCRDQVVLATKVGARPRHPGAPWPEEREGLSARSITTGIEHSLRRLQTDVIDVYFTHVEDRSVPLEEMLVALDGLVRDGKVRTLGCSNLATWRMEQTRSMSRRNGWAEFVCAQMRYSYLRPKRGADFGVQVTVSEELLDYAAADGAFPILAYSALLQGAFTRSDRRLPDEYCSRDSEMRLRVLADLAAETGLTAHQLVIAWLLHHPTPIIPLIAASRTDQLAENLRALDVSLSPEHYRRLTTAGE